MTNEKYEKLSAGFESLWDAHYNPLPPVETMEEVRQAFRTKWLAFLAEQESNEGEWEAMLEERLEKNQPIIPPK
jgi:hypothetical protein